MPLKAKTDKNDVSCDPPKMLKKIPVVTDKEEDFESGACYIFGTQKLVNSKVAGLLGVSIPDSMKSDPTVTVR